MRPNWRRAAIVGVLTLAPLLLLGGCSGSSPAPAETPSWTLPPAGGRFSYQLGGSYTPEQGVRVLTRDWHTRPAKGLYNICYVDTFQTQPEAEADWLQRHPDLLLRIDGDPVEDPNWPKQYLLDTSTAVKRERLLAVMTPWIRSCAKKGFDAVELDNLDSWYRSSDHLTQSDNLAFARALVGVAHGLGLAAAQKNGAVLDARGKQLAHFDFAVAESCQVYSECSRYTSTYGRHVIEIEYTDTGDAVFQQACAARGGQISVIQRDRLVVPLGKPDYRYAAC